MVVEPDDPHFMVRALLVKATEICRAMQAAVVIVLLMVAAGGRMVEPGAMGTATFLNVPVEPGLRSAAEKSMPGSQTLVVKTAALMKKMPEVLGAEVCAQADVLVDTHGSFNVDALNEGHVRRDGLAGSLNSADLGWSSSRDFDEPNEFMPAEFHMAEFQRAKLRSNYRSLGKRGHSFGNKCDMFMDKCENGWKITFGLAMNPSAGEMVNYVENVDFKVLDGWQF